jgi:surfactin synthase thioesterase subunit
MSTTHDPVWVRTFHPAPPGAPRVFCFPHAGGSSTFYFPVSAALSGVAEVLALQYPGRQDRRHETPISDMDTYADRVHAALGTVTGAPIVFFGHSLGAVLAFEVARRLERDGVVLDTLFVSGRRAPSVHRDEDVHKRDDDGVLAELRRLSGTDARLFDDAELVRMVMPAMRADFAAVETYRGTPGAAVGCPVVALTGDADPMAAVDEVRAWQAHTTGSFDLRVYPGGHFYLLQHATAVIGEIAAQLPTPSSARTTP